MADDVVRERQMVGRAETCQRSAWASSTSYRQAGAEERVARDRDEAAAALDVVLADAADRVVDDLDARDVARHRDAVALGHALLSGVVDVVDGVAGDQDVADETRRVDPPVQVEPAALVADVVADDLQMVAGLEHVEARRHPEPLDAEVVAARELDAVEGDRRAGCGEDRHGPVAVVPVDLEPGVVAAVDHDRVAGGREVQRARDRAQRRVPATRPPWRCGRRCTIRSCGRRAAAEARPRRPEHERHQEREHGQSPSGSVRGGPSPRAASSARSTATSAARWPRA